MAHAGPTRLLPGVPYPLGATWDGLGINFAVFSAHAERIELCLFDPVRPARDRALRAAGMHRRGLARLPAQRARRPDLRLSRPRSLRAAATAIASIRTSCCSIPMRGASPATLRWSDALFGYRVNSPRADLSFDRRDSAPGMLKAVVSDDMLQLGRRPAARRPVVRHRHLRGACARPDHAATRHACQRARHLRGAGATRRHRPPASPRRHRRRAAAGPCLRAGPHPARSRACSNYWGYNTIGFFAIEPRYLSDGIA